MPPGVFSAYPLLAAFTLGYGLGPLGYGDPFYPYPVYAYPIDAYPIYAEPCPIYAPPPTYAYYEPPPIVPYYAVALW